MIMLIRPRRPLAPGIIAAAFLSATLAGCAGTLKHSVSLTEKFRENPVRNVHIFAPGYPKKVKRLKPEDLHEMKPENQEESSRRIVRILAETLSASIMVESDYTPDAAAREWAADIALDLAKGRIPLSVEPHIIPVASVMIIGAIQYGRELDQIKVTLPFIPFPPWTKSWFFGEPKWEHVCHLQAILVDPRNGDVLMDILHEARLKDPTDDPALTDRMTREVGWAMVEAFFPEE